MAMLTGRLTEGYEDFFFFFIVFNPQDEILSMVNGVLICPGIVVYSIYFAACSHLWFRFC